MRKVVRTNLEEILEHPDEYLGKEVEIEGTMLYAGKTPRGPVYTVNLPEEEYCVGLLISGDHKIVCYRLEQLCFSDYDNKRVVVSGILKRMHDTIVLKALSIRFRE